MLRELISELREFEGLTSDFEQSEVLAWRVDAMMTAIRSKSLYFGGAPARRMRQPVGR